MEFGAEAGLSIRVAISSKDSRLIQSCREVLTELYGADWSLTVRDSAEVIPDDELRIWDFVSHETDLPLGTDSVALRKHLFVLHRNHLPALHSLLSTSDLNVLLRPVTRSTLKAFLGGAAEGSTNSFRLERDEMLQFLIQANLKLQEYDQERNNFLARSIHDFRAPLTAVTGYCDLLLQEELGPVTEDQRDALERMRHSARRLKRLSDAMFQLSIPRDVQQRLKLERADIRECVDRALQEVSPAVEEKRISVTVDIEPSLRDLFLDKAQIEQMLVNLVENACKFTPRDGFIEVRGYPFFWERRTVRATSIERAADRRVSDLKAANAFRMDIRDSGPAIPPTHVERIFEEHTSYCGAQDRSGGGLGLAICRMILHQHRGRVWAESSSAGAVFSFVLPFDPNGAGLCPQGQAFDRLVPVEVKNP